MRKTLDKINKKLYNNNILEKLRKRGVHLSTDLKRIEVIGCKLLKLR